MTRAMIATLALAVIGQIVYQLGQRAVPTHASPLIVLTLAYTAGALLCIGLAWVQGEWTGAALQAAWSWPTAAIAMSIVAIEIGYLLAYRSGWTLGSAFASASTITVFALAILGQLIYANPLSARMLLGLVLSSVAFWLLMGG